MNIWNFSWDVSDDHEVQGLATKRQKKYENERKPHYHWSFKILPHNGRN